MLKYYKLYKHILCIEDDNINIIIKMPKCSDDNINIINEYQIYSLIKHKSFNSFDLILSNRERIDY